MGRDHICEDTEHSASKKRNDSGSQAKKNAKPQKCVFNFGVLD